MKASAIVVWGCVVGWGITAVCWLWDVSRGGVPLLLSRGVVASTLLLTVVASLWLIARIWQGGRGESLSAADRWLLLLVILGLAVHWIGVDWEVTGRYYRDEGIYFAAANDINQGQVLPESFIYGHLPYYIYALALWIQNLFPAAFAWIAGALFGVTKEVDVSWILLRGIDTSLGALTIIPVFVIARRIAGLPAAVIGSVLMIFSPLYNEITRLIISDVPSAFFAALSLMFVALLLDEERYWPYLMAGMAAGLAAACKYPAGVVAVAIVGIWIAWRFRSRRWSWHLLSAGAVSLATFLLVMPAFWAHSESVFVGQGKDLLFGFRQYGRGGWIGVMPTSNAAWYGRQVLTSFGLPIVLLGLSGWPWLKKESRRRLLWMLPFPVVYLALLVSMSMVVKRNLLPVIPALAALLGVGVAGWLQLSERRLPRLRTGWASLFVVLALAVPVYRTTLQTIALARTSTREEAAAWIDSRIPRGATIIKESYTPHLHKKKYTVHQTRFAARLPIEEIRSGDWDYVLLARNAYGRFLNPENWVKPHHEIFARSYEEMLQFERLQEFVPTRTRMGPTLELYKVDPPDLEYLEVYEYAFEEGGFRYPRDDAYLLLKQYMAPGDYEIHLTTEPPSVDGRVRIVTRDGREAGDFPVADSRGTADLAWQAKYFFYIYLPKDTVISGVTLENAAAE